MSNKISKYVNVMSFEPSLCYLMKLLQYYFTSLRYLEVRLQMLRAHTENLRSLFYPSCSWLAQLNSYSNCSRVVKFELCKF